MKHIEGVPPGLNIEVIYVPIVDNTNNINAGRGYFAVQIVRMHPTKGKQILRTDSVDLMQGDGAIGNRLAHSTAIAHYVATAIVRELMGDGSFKE